jgi:hypothetical protein
MRKTRFIRSLALLIFVLALAMARFVESGDARLAAHLQLTVDPLMPARVYLFKDDQPFRLSPVQAQMPLRLDLFYRERMWVRSPDPDVLEVTCKDESHFFLLKGRAALDLPAGHYRVEAYRGLFFEPAVEQFDLRAAETRQVALRLRDWTGGARKEWLSSDDHIHLTRAREDNSVYLSWLEAEDLSVANFLQLQRQMDAAVQYGFGAHGEARKNSYCIRSGHESRSDPFGHVNLLGGREMIRPLSVGSMYANSPDVWPYPSVLFARGRELGATVGYAHFDGSRAHSTLLMDLALGNIDFLEVFQFAVLKTEAWYELLNAGFQVTGIAGSDFPGSLGRLKPWPRWIPLLGPERTLVKTRTAGSPYDAWAEGVRRGSNVVVTNGPLVEISVDRRSSTATATASFFRPLERLEIVRNGQSIAKASGDGKRMSLTLTARLDGNESAWWAARVWAQRLQGEPEIQGHTNPVYVLKDGKPVWVRAARAALAERWRAEVDWYRKAGLIFGTDSHQTEFFADAQRALERLNGPPQLVR